VCFASRPAASAGGPRHLQRTSASANDEAKQTGPTQAVVSQVRPQCLEDAMTTTDTSGACSRNALPSCPRPLCSVRCSSRRVGRLSGRDTCTPDERTSWDRPSVFSSLSLMCRLVLGHREATPCGRSTATP
jgi:hypothetical protein